MAENSLKIRIDGDASDYEKKLSGLKVKTKASLADIKAGIDMTTQAVGKLIEVASKGVNYNATLEQYRTSFEVMTGSAEKAADVVERLRTMGAETPFETTDLVQVTQLLMQYGFTADDAIEKMSMLGDIAQGNKEAMVSIATGYAQMSSAGKVNLQDIKQMINGGFNPLQEISERTGESMASLYDRISKGTMAISEITDSMRYATSEGGKFYQSMEKQSHTLNGQLSTLKDNAMQLLGSLTSGLSDELSSSMLPMVNNLVSELQNALDEGGYQAFLDKATDMIPDLLNMLSDKIEVAIAGASRWAPKLADALMGNLPTALRQATSIIPQITTALFEVATTVLTDLVGMLPELLPIVADGLAGFAKSIVDGLGDVFSGLWTSIKEVIHNGADKSEMEIAGMWVDKKLVADIEAGFTFKADTDDVVASIDEAYRTIRIALMQSPLTDEQKQELMGMLGADAEAIKAKLQEFGMSPDEAAALAQQIADNGSIISSAFDDLDIGIDSQTLARLTMQANGSRIMLKSLLASEGLTPAEIDEVVGVYDELTGKIGEQVPSIVEEIYDRLSDGKPDDAETVAALTGGVESWAQSLLEEIDRIYQEQLSALDEMSADYEEQKAELDAWYESSREEVTALSDSMSALISELAGAPTAVVKARMEELAAMEQQVSGLEDRVSAMEAKTASAAESAYQVVRSGAKTDEATLGLAIDYKITSFQLDKQSAEDAYSAAVAQLNDDLAKGKITQEQYNADIASAQAEMDAAIAAAQAELENAMGQILAGVAEASGTEAIWSKAGEKMQMADLLKSLWTSLDTQNFDYLGDDLKQMLADQLGTSVEGLADMPIQQVKTAASALAMNLEEEAASALENANTDMIFAAYQAMMDKGLTGTSLNVENSSQQMGAVLSSIMSAGAAAAEPVATDAGESLGKAATSKMGDKAGAKKAGQDTTAGLKAGLSTAVSTARDMGKMAGSAFASGYRQTMQIQSPSKVMKRLGEYTGEGLEIGLNASMSRAVRVANTMLGGLTTSADLTRMTNVNMPELRQEISIAAEQNKVPVNIDGRKVAEIQGQNNASQLAWLRARDARGYGQR